MAQPDATRSEGLVAMFMAADSAIERRRTDNIFKQLDERSLTAEEERIIQQRVELQRQLLQEYERREQQRKVAELQDLWPELGQPAAARALELCGGREDEAALRLTEDAAFRRRVATETGSALALLVPRAAPGVAAGAGIPPPHGVAAGAGGATGARFAGTSVLDGGALFVGRFRSKLGPYQHQQPLLERERGSCYSGTSVRTITAAIAAASSAAGAQQAAAGATLASSSGSRGPPPHSGFPEPGTAEALLPLADAAAPNTDSPTAATAAAAETVPGMKLRSGCGRGGSGGSSSTAGVVGSENSSAQQQRVTAMMARQVARLEPPLAAARLLEFEVRRPGASGEVLELLSAQYGPEVASPIATAWEVLLAQQAWEAAESMAALEAARSAYPAVKVAAAGAPAAVQATTPRSPQHDGSGSTDAGVAAALAAAAALAGSSLNSEAHAGAPATAALIDAAPTPAATSSCIMPRELEQLQQQQQHSGDHHQQQQQQECVDPGEVSDASTITEPTGSPDKPRLLPQNGARSDAYGGASSSTEACPPLAHEQDNSAPPPGRRSSRRAAAVAAVTAVTAAAAAAARDDDHHHGGGGSAGTGSRGSHSLLALHRSSVRAISDTGHTCRGRVRQKSHKCTELVELGTLLPHPLWHNAGYIFPAGFRSRLLFRSSVDLDALTLHECEIVGEGGRYWPAPTFVVTARDRPDEPVVAKSCTGCWSGILKRINAVIAARIAAGESLPPPPRTAIAGPEYFGLNDAATVAAVESLDPQRLCESYWLGKQQREAAVAGMPLPVQPAAPRGGGGGSKPNRKRARQRTDALGDADDEAEGSGYHGMRWSSISRHERYAKRCAEAGEVAAPAEPQLLPGVLDPVTLEPVVTPAISPAGHVMGLATWRAVLAETGRCPFTKVPMRPDQLTVLTRTNIERYRDRIVAV